MTVFHAERIENVFRALRTSERGLSSSAIEERRKTYGINRLPQRQERSRVVIFLSQLRSWFIYVLFAAALLSFTFAKLLDAGVIMAIVIMNAIIGYLQERKAETAIHSLQSLIVPKAKVLRDGIVDLTSAEELVVGDIIFLQAGDRVPADARIVHTRDCSANEASLTGETFPVEKHARTVPAEASVADRPNMLWMGTLVVTGTAKAVVVAVGAKTALGAIATSIARPEQVTTHFHKKTNTLALQLGILAFVAAAATFAIGYWVRALPPLEVFIFSVATLVSSIPEGLPAVLAIVLAIGAFRMAQRNAIVRHMPVIEDLSVASVIITDKTGTLTRNTMMVKTIAAVEKDIVVSGEGWDPHGSFFSGKAAVDPLQDPVLHKLLQVAALCNNASIHLEGDRYEVVGDPTEASFVVLAEKAGITKELIAEQRMVLDQAPFSQETRAQSVLVARPEKELYVIGSEEMLLSASTHAMTAKGAVKLDVRIRTKLRERAGALTSQAMRVVACGYRHVPQKNTRITPDLLKELTFLGFLGITDPLRPEAAQAISDAQRAGIRVIMATGDHASTAAAIARELSLATTKIYTESELRELSEPEFRKVAETATVFARMTPEMKLKLIRTLQEQGKIVAMIGDGVNDAPALKFANVGIAMGSIGTDVAREAADIVLSDDNFSSLMKAIEQGRLIFNNVRQTSFFMITTSLAEIVTILSCLTIGSDLPLTALQILWINLITDGIPNIALAAEGQHGDLLTAPPRKSTERILAKDLIPYLLITVLVMAAVTVFAFVTYLPFGIEKARTVAFALMIFFQLVNVLNMRSLEHSLFRIGIFSNQFITGALVLSFVLQLFIMVAPFTRKAFGLVQLSLVEFIGLGVMSLSILVCVELYKAWLQFKRRRRGYLPSGQGSARNV